MSQTLASRSFRGLKVSLEFKPEDLWVGVYWRMDLGFIWEFRDYVKTRREWDVFICLLPMLPIRLSWVRTSDGWPVELGLDFGVSEG